jgi:hypothetical protein
MLFQLFVNFAPIKDFYGDPESYLFEVRENYWEDQSS